MKSKLRIVIMIMVLSFSFTLTAYAGWKQDNKGHWFEYDNGSFAKSGIKTIDGVGYAFGDDGYMLTGWQYIAFKWYYFDTGTGAQAMGWKQLDGKWYYLNPNEFGEMYTYWLDLGKNRYYLDEDGVMKTGVFYLSDSTTGSAFAYEADENGILVRNTTRKNGNRTIRYDDSGVMMYRNDTTSQVAEATGENEWQYVLNEEDMLAQKEENDKIIEVALKELQNSLYQEYRDKVLVHKVSTQKEYRQQWEKRARKKLLVFQSSEDAESYIKSVENGTFRKYVLTEEEQDDDMDEDYYDDWYYED